MSPRSLTAPTSSLNYYVSPPLHDQTDGFDGMMLTVNFPFLDDIKNGVKFKHVVSCRESLRLTSALSLPPHSLPQQCFSCRCCAREATLRCHIHRCFFVPQIPLERGSGDTMKNDNTYKLGPFVTTTDFFRNQHITLRVKDKMTRHGATVRRCPRKDDQKYNFVLLPVFIVTELTI